MLFIDQTPCDLSQTDFDNCTPKRSFSPITLLSVLDVSLDETIARFSKTSGRVSERILHHGMMSDVELIAGLQGMDRLHQELSACTSILKRCVTQLSGADDMNPSDDPIANVSLADFKKLIYDRCCNEEAMLTSPRSK